MIKKVKYQEVDRTKYDIVVVSRFNPWRGGGLENVAKQQILALRDAGLKVATLFRRREKRETTPLNVDCFIINDKISWLSSTLADIIYALPMYVRLLRINAKVIIDNFEFPLIYRLLGGSSPVVKVNHGSPKYLKSYSGIKAIFALAYYLIYKYLYILSCKVVNLNIAVSYKVKEEMMRDYRVPKEKIITIPNGINVKKFRVLNKILSRKLFGFSTNKRIILFIGGDLERKNFWLALKVVNELRKHFSNILFVVVTSRKNKALLEKKLNLRWLKILTEVPSDKMPYLYNAADMILLPSKYEGLPLTLLEALACGCPAVVSANSAEKEYHGQGYLIAHTFEEYIKYSKQLLKNQRFWKEMSAKGRKLACSRYSTERHHMAYRVITKMFISENPQEER